MKFEYTEENIQYVMNLIQKNLTPDLLKSNHRIENESNPMYGHCKHSSEALILLMDTDRLHLMWNRIPQKPEKGHVWVQDKDKIYDITAEQFYCVGEDPFYGNSLRMKCVSSHTTDTLIRRVLWTHQELSQGNSYGSVNDL